MRPAALSSLVGLVSLPLAATAATPSLRGEAAVAAGVDDNALRSSEAPVSDAFGQLRGSLGVAAREGDLDAALEAGLAARRFVEVTGANERTATGRLSLSAAASPIAPFAELTGLDRRQQRGARDLTELAGRLGLATAPWERLDAELYAGARTFSWHAAPALDSTGPAAGVLASLRLGERHVLAAGWDGSLRHFPSADAFDDDGARIGARRDVVQTARLGWRWQRRALVSLAWAFTHDASNGAGLSTDVHRLDGSLGLPLPAALLAVAQVSLQWARFPDGVADGAERLVDREDEGLSTVSLRLLRPLGDDLDVEVTAQATSARLDDAGDRYARLTGTVGLRASFE